VIEAGSGIAALSLLHQHQPGVVIADIVMPKMDGIAFLREVRSINPKVKVIAISAGGDGKYPDPLALAREFGAAETLSKPFAGRELRAAVTRLLPDAK
jgi:DNA-binding response OmpR family regulator